MKIALRRSKILIQRRITQVCSLKILQVTGLQNLAI